MAIKDENFIVISGWMITKLKLSGSKLLVYAIIYGFTQNECGKFTGSTKYLMDWTGLTKTSILNSLKDLTNDGLLHKTEYYKNNLKFCEYSALTPFTTGTENCPEAVQKLNQKSGTEIKPNIYISSDTDSDISISPYNPPKGDEPKPKKKSQKDSINYDEVLEKFKAICISLPKPLQLSDSRKRAIKKIEPLITKFGGWEKFFEKIQSSSFLTGNKTQWKAEFDWVLKEKNAIKIIEGSYDDAEQVNNQQQETKPNLADSQQRDDTVATFLGLNSLDELENYGSDEK